MEAVRYRFLSVQNDEPTGPVYTALVKPGETFDNGNEVALRRCKSMIVEVGDFRMQPRRIRKRRDGKWEMSYGWPRGKSWSQGCMIAPIHVVEIM